MLPSGEWAVVVPLWHLWWGWGQHARHITYASSLDFWVSSNVHFLLLPQALVAVRAQPGVPVGCLCSQPP